MRVIDKAIIHCSDSRYGDVDLFRKWHKDRGWIDIAYHYVILNCYPTFEHYDNKTPDVKSDGAIQSGRQVRLQGAHCRGHNEHSIGICLVGKAEFTGSQIISLAKLLSRQKFSHLDIFGHCEFNKSKTCPNIDMDYLREKITSIYR